MEVVAHTDAGEFARLARPLLEPDPVQHTSTLTVLDAVCRGTFPPAAMLTVHEGRDAGRSGAVVGALLCTAGWPAFVSGLPPRTASAAVDALLRHGLDPGGAQGPVAEAEAFGAAWAARTGASCAAGLRMRLFALEHLRPPVDVPGRARAATPDDETTVDVLTAWRQAFEVELRHDGHHTRTSRDDVVRMLAGGSGELLWEVDGVPVALASARPVTAGMSRIGPVYTPPEHRCHGYAAAATAAAARWALDRGARDVLLYTDLANPTTNRLYPRLGFRPRFDAVELRFVT